MSEPAFISSFEMAPDPISETADLATKDGMLAFVKSYGEYAIERFNAAGELRPMFGIVVTWNPGTNESFPYPLGVRFFVPDMTTGATFDQVERQKSAIASFMRTLAVRSKAIGVVTLIEGWTAGTFEPDGKPKYRSYADDPNRGETLLQMAEHIRLDPPLVRVAPIVRNALGRARVTAFTEKTDVRHGKGRFCDLLNRERYA